MYHFSRPRWFNTKFSLDQTVRIHSSSPKLNGRWFELARAQTHGYDCIKAIFLSDLRMASISDEKVTRVFDAPRAFVHLAHNLGIRTEDENALVREVTLCCYLC